MNHTTVAIIGAGPIGLELAIALKQNNIPFLLFDRAQAAQMIFNFPVETLFFSSTERIGIAGIPIQIPTQQKCSREEYLAYIRAVILQHQLHIHTYEEVVHIENQQEKGFKLTTNSARGKTLYQARFIVIATGSTSCPRLLQIPGEDLPQVSIKLEDPHQYFQKNVIIVGGKNSAAEAALRCFNAGAKVTLVVRRKEIEPEHVKYWILPELLGRISRGEIQCYYESEIIEILPTYVRLKHAGNIVDVTADFVIKAIGFIADMTLLEQLGVPLVTEQHRPAHQETTMETPVANVYVAGTIIGGTQKRYRIFIENTHVHVERILKSIAEKLGIKPLFPSQSFLTRTSHLEE